MNLVLVGARRSIRNVVGGNMTDTIKFDVDIPDEHRKVYWEKLKKFLKNMEASYSVKHGALHIGDCRCP